MEWLVDYADTHWRRNRNYDIMSKTIGAVELLRLRSGIKRLDLESALIDDTVPSNVATIPGHNPEEIGEFRVPLISIFSNESESFKRRPSREKVDRLSEILGKQPRWWVDYDDPRDYRE